MPASGSELTEFSLVPGLQAEMANEGCCAEGPCVEGECAEGQCAEGECTKETAKGDAPASCEDCNESGTSDSLNQ